MSLLENIKSTLQSGWTIAKEKSELGARIGRLRLELIRLTRDREALFARLGRAYHANLSDLAGLQVLTLEIDRLTQTMRDRESVMAQLLEQDALPRDQRGKDSPPEQPLDFAAEDVNKP